MATEKQLQANRQNALKSTGPKSALGKQIASRNATRHGYYSTCVLLAHEDREEFLRLARRLVSAYSPCGLLEEEVVRTILETHWQLRRANVVDSELFEIYGFYKGQPRGVGTAFAQDATQGNAFSKLTVYQSFLLRKLHRAQKELEALKAQSAKALPVPPPPLLLATPAVELSDAQKELPAVPEPEPALGAAQVGRSPVCAESPANHEPEP